MVFDRTVWEMDEVDFAVVVTQYSHLMASQWLDGLVPQLVSKALRLN